MTKHSMEVLEKSLKEAESLEEEGLEEKKEVEELEEIWQHKEYKAEVEARHMPEEKASRGHKG